MLDQSLADKPAEVGFVEAEFAEILDRNGEIPWVGGCIFGVFEGVQERKQSRLEF